MNADVLAALLGMEAIVEVVAARKVIKPALPGWPLYSTEEDFEEIEILRKIERAAQRNQPLFSLTSATSIAVARATPQQSAGKDCLVLQTR